MPVKHRPQPNALPNQQRKKTVWQKIVEFGFHLLYNQFAWTYDVVSWSVSLGEWRKWQMESLNFLRGPAVLEIAHGPGHMLVEMHRRGWQVTGLDLSAAMGRLAAARLKRHGLDQQVPLLRCKIPNIPLKSESFDAVLSQFPTGFIFEPQTLNTLHRLLKPAGVLVIMPEGHLLSRGPVARFIHWLFVITGQTAGAQDAPSAEAEFGRFWGQVQQQIESAGFTARIETIELAKSSATVIVAEKI